jgi:hypothetical protein
MAQLLACPGLRGRAPRRDKSMGSYGVWDWTSARFSQGSLG